MENSSIKECECIDMCSVDNTFRRELESLINRHSQENKSNTPDFILAEYLTDCLKAFNKATKWRTDRYKWQMEEWILRHRSNKYKINKEKGKSLEKKRGERERKRNQKKEERRRIRELLAEEQKERIAKEQKRKRNTEKLKSEKKELKTEIEELINNPISDKEWGKCSQKRYREYVDVIHHLSDVDRRKDFVAYYQLHKLYGLYGIKKKKKKKKRNKKQRVWQTEFKKAKEKKFADTCGYIERNKNVRKIGFPSYEEYLKSDLWEKIRERVKKRDKYRCQCCKGNHRIQVHHTSYQPKVLLGEQLDPLITLCEFCHHKIEFDDLNEKIFSFSEINQRLNMLKQSNVQI